MAGRPLAFLRGLFGLRDTSAPASRSPSGPIAPSPADDAGADPSTSSPERVRGGLSAPSGGEVFEGTPAPLLYHPPIRREDYPREADPRSILPADGSYQRQHSHSGTTWAIDLAVSVGSPVYAHADGLVSRTSNESDPANGVGVWVKTLNGLLADVTVASIHLSHRLVEWGETVEAGQIIGYSGNTGNSEGPHLHWEVGAMVDPMSPDLFDWAGAGWD